MPGAAERLVSFVRLFGGTPAPRQVRPELRAADLFLVLNEHSFDLMALPPEEDSEKAGDDCETGTVFGC